MIYIIENRVLFNMDENAFTLLEDGNEKIIISNPARRVLALLIEQHGSSSYARLCSRRFGMIMV